MTQDIIGAEFDEKELSLHIYVGVRKTAAIACPRCGSQTKRNGYEPKERVWRHGDVMFYPCLVHCRRPKVLCQHCGSVQVNAPFERKNSRFTLLFEGYAGCQDRRCAALRREVIGQNRAILDQQSSRWHGFA